MSKGIRKQKFTDVVVLKVFAKSTEKALWWSLFYAKLQTWTYKFYQNITLCWRCFTLNFTILGGSGLTKHLRVTASDGGGGSMIVHKPWKTCFYFSRTFYCCMEIFLDLPNFRQVFKSRKPQEPSSRQLEITHLEGHLQFTDLKCLMIFSSFS